MEYCNSQNILHFSIVSCDFYLRTKQWHRFRARGLHGQSFEKKICSRARDCRREQEWPPLLSELVVRQTREEGLTEYKLVPISINVV